ncbi:MBL fold metallo-hydrolase [Phenylobacterium sp. LjRoot219]|uniref:MBL fold metallo-hydrolase n=1 Tax=Phenylobacterium sp. LjRoot219 TaxID=3342283 RepID=UPI003ECDE34D
MSQINIGSAQIRSVLEMALTRRPIAYLAAEPALIEANRSWLAPHFLEEGDTWSLNFQTWVLQVDSKVVVVDPCTGNGRPHPIPQFDRLETPYIERFCATGVRPEDVDYVFCTHMHHDHCGWNTQLRDGRWVPTFPNARYLFVRREYERWDPNGADYRAVDYNDGVYERSIQPIVEAGLADLVMDRHRVTPSLEIEPAHGHTLGHAMLSLQSEAQEAYFTGDVFHHPLQLIRPELQFGDCDDLAQAIETRRRLVARGLEREALIIPAHLPFPHAGRLRRDGETLVFAPATGATGSQPD